MTHRTRILLSALAGLLIISPSACTQQQRAKSFGGTATEKLPDNRKLITVTWKDAHLWYLTRPMTAADTAVTYEFKESSSYGLLNGTVIITETKTTP